MKVKTIKVPAIWMVSGYYEYSYAADMPEEEAKRLAKRLAEKSPLPETGEYLTDSFRVDEEGITTDDEEYEAEDIDIVGADNLITRVTYKVQLTRELKEGEMISPGSYTIMNDEETRFDFMDFEGYKEGDAVIAVVHKNLDLGSFPKSSQISPDIIKDSVFTEIYIDLEDCKEDVKVLRVFGMSMEFKDGTVVDVDDKAIQNVFADLSFYKCIQLLNACVENGVINRDPSDKNNIIEFRKEAPGYPKGWYSQNIMTAASELANDIFGQRYLLGVLGKKGINVELKDPWWSEESPRKI